jgi:tetratricopeptide (TPR) repeat protein
LGTIYQRQQRKAEALECFDKSLAVWPANVIALAHRGELRLRTGDAGGLEDLAKAVEADPKGVSPAGRRARTILVALAKVKQASQEKARAVAQR